MKAEPVSMQQSLSNLPNPGEYAARRGQRPGLMKRAQFVFMLVLFVLDVACIGLAFWAAHEILVRTPDIVIGPFLEFWQLPVTYGLVLVTIYFAQRMYRRRRPVTHLDEFFRIIVYNVLATLFTVALLTLFLREFQYHRAFILLGAGLTIVFDTFARVIHAQLQWQAQAKGMGDDRVLLIGAGEIGQLLLNKILLQPKLGYQIVGVIDAGKQSRSAMPAAVPVLGALADVPWIIDRYGVDEVIIGLPESSNQELVNIISLCEREKVGIRVFPDVFQFMASEVTIGDLGGLPLLTIRDVALQGWKLTVKRIMDMILSAIGLVFLSPFMLLAACSSSSTAPALSSTRRNAWVWTPSRSRSSSFAPCTPTPRRKAQAGRRPTTRARQSWAPSCAALILTSCRS
jgi:hypothetical protein